MSMFFLFAEDGVEMLFESCGGWRRARRESSDEDGAECFMRGKHTFMDRALHQKGIRGPSRERGESRLTVLAGRTGLTVDAQIL